MLVKAIQMGEYGHLRRRPGSVFELKPRKMKNGAILSVEQQFSPKWMKKLNDKQIAQFEAEQAAKNESEDADLLDDGAQDEAEQIAMAGYKAKEEAEAAVKKAPKKKSGKKSEKSEKPGSEFEESSEA